MLSSHIVRRITLQRVSKYSPSATTHAFRSARQPLIEFRSGLRQTVVDEAINGKKSFWACSRVSSRVKTIPVLRFVAMLDVNVANFNVKLLNKLWCEAQQTPPPAAT